MTLKLAADRNGIRPWSHQLRLRVGALSWATAAVICLTLAYLLVWNHGQYLDDYSVYRYPIHLSLEARSLGALANDLLARLLHSNEALGRLVVALTIGANGLLLGWLLKRLSGSWSAAVVGGWLFISPVWAFEAVMWASAYSYLSATTFLLLQLHAGWTVITGKSRGHRLMALAAASTALAAVAWMHEPPAVTALTAPPFWTLVAWRGGFTSLGAAARRGVALIVTSGAIVAGAVLELYTRSGNQSGHSTAEITTNGLFARSLGYLERARWMTISADWGRQVFESALRDGWKTATSSLPGEILVALMLVSVLIALAGLRSRKAPRIRGEVALILIAWGLVAAVLTLLFPSVLISNLQLEYRLLYAPGVGLCAAAGVALALIATPAPGRTGDAIVLLVAGIAMFVASLTMVGVADAYAQRAQLDAAEAMAFRRALPSSELPPRVVLVPVDTEPQLRSTTFGMMLIGLFNDPFVGRGLVDPLYPNSRFQWVDMNYWSGIAFDRRGDGGLLEAGGVPLPPDDSVVFTYRNGKVVLMDQITLVSSDGSRTAYVFPLARRLGAGTSVAITLPRGAAVLSLPPPDPATAPG